jgi:hypothetical protein
VLFLLIDILMALDKYKLTFLEVFAPKLMDLHVNEEGIVIDKTEDNAPKLNKTFILCTDFF